MNSSSVEVNKKGRKSSWDHNQDLWLTKAFIATKINPVKNADKTFNSIWEQVLEVFNEDEICRTANRSHRSLESRWQKVILPEVNKFCEYLAQVSNPSDATETDRIEMAKKKYSGECKKVFAFEACWKELSKYPKWSSTGVSSTGASKENPAITRRPPVQQAEKANIPLKKKVKSIKDDCLENRDEVLQLEREKIAHMKMSNRLQQASLEEQRKSRELEIMRVDLSQLDEVQREFFELERRDILTRRKANSNNLGELKDREDESSKLE